MKTETINPLCMNVNFLNITYKIFALTEDRLQEEKRKLIDNLNNEFTCVRLIKFNEVVDFNNRENISSENIEFTFNASDYGL